MIQLLRRVARAVRNYEAGGDASQWHPSGKIESYPRLQRLFNDDWQYREMTEDEKEDWDSRRAW